MTEMRYQLTCGGEVICLSAHLSPLAQLLENYSGINFRAWEAEFYQNGELEHIDYKITWIGNDPVELKLSELSSQNFNN